MSEISSLIPGTDSILCILRYYINTVNPWHACAAGLTVLVLCLHGEVIFTSKTFSLFAKELVAIVQFILRFITAKGLNNYFVV